MVALFPLQPWASACDQKFMNTVAANYLTLACNLDSENETKACDLKDNYDGRSITSKRKLELDSSGYLGGKPDELAKYFSQIFKFLTGRNLYLTSAKIILHSSEAGGICNGDRYFWDDGERVNVETFANDKYVKKLTGSKHCIPDYHPFENAQIESFFSLSDQQRVKELKDTSTCKYYTKINRILKKLVQENVEIDTKSSGKGKKAAESSGRN